MFFIMTDAAATSFIAFFALFLGGFLTLLFLGCFIHCCCSLHIPHHQNGIEITDEAIICERLTKKERLDVFEKLFSDYDSMGRSKCTNNNNCCTDIEACFDRNNMNEIDNQNRICVICLESMVINNNISKSTMDKHQEEGSIYNNNSNTLCPPEDSDPITNNNEIMIETTIGSSSSSNSNSKVPIIQGFRCNHCYHRACIKPWFEQGKLSCPCCRIDLLNPCDFRCAVLSVLRKERLQVLQRWGVSNEWANISTNYNNDILQE